MDVWELLEHPAQGCERVANLYSWTLNYEPAKGPFSLFLDVIGFSADYIGETIYQGNLNESGLGYLEIGMLTDALREYADRPVDVVNFVTSILEAEASE